MGKINTKDATGRTVTLTRVRVSFADSLDVASLPKKNKDPNAKPKHGANFILEKGSPDYESNIEACATAMSNACVEFKKPADWWRKLLENSPDKLCFKRGNSFQSDKGEIYKGYEGNNVLTLKGPAGGVKRPQIRDRYKKIIHDPATCPDTSRIKEVAYNGSYSDIIVSFYGTDNGGADRLTGSVEAIRSWQEGERLGGGGIYVDDDDFDTLEADDSFDSGPKTGAASSGSLLDL